MKKTKFKIIFSLIILTLIIFIGSVKVNADEIKYDTDWAVDVFNKPLDDGIGKFICKSTDSDSPIKENTTSAYYVFEYLRNDSKNPLCDKYVLVSKYNVPEFVYNALDNSEIILGIHEGYWTFCNKNTVIHEIDSSVLLSINKKDVLNSPFFEDRVMYLKFDDVQIDYITSIHIKYRLYYKANYIIVKKWKYKNVEKIILPESTVVINDDSSGADFTNVSYIHSKWNGELISTLNDPYYYNGVYYTHRVVLFSGVCDKDYYFGSKKNTKTIEICNMTYETFGIQYDVENINISKLEIEKGDSIDDLPFEFNLFNYLKKFFKYIIIFLSAFLILLFFNKKNKDKN